VTFWDSRVTKEVKSLYLTSQVMDDDQESILSQFANADRYCGHGGFAPACFTVVLKRIRIEAKS